MVDFSACDLVKLASPTWEFANWVTESFHGAVNWVALSATLFVQNYNTLVDEVNQEIRHLVDFFPHIQFWKHHGMRLNWCVLLHNDKAHLAAVGDKLYYRSIRGTI